jgi:hypothetical protein
MESITFASPYDAIAAVGAYLKNHYNLVIERSDNGTNWTGTSGSLTLYLRTDMDRGDGESDDGLTDIGGNVSDAFKVNGFPCLSWAINNYTANNGDGSTSTVQVNTQSTTVSQDDAKKAAAAAQEKPFDLLSFLGLGGVGTTFAAGGVGLLVGGVLAIGVIIFLMVQPKANVTV